jgi:hypothetical protein
MNESVPTTFDTSAHDTTCPNWCVSTDEEHAEGTHDGPKFGGVAMQLLEDGRIGAFVPEYEDALSADELLDLAAELHAAAAWIATVKA